MSIYGYFACTTCKRYVWLGKAVFSDIGINKVKLFYGGTGERIPNHENHKLNMVLWKMLADHQGHNIHVYLESEFDRLLDSDDGYVKIGGDSDLNISFEDYLSGKKE